MAATEGPLAGHGALITGGGSGIGLQCARHLVRDGASVTITGRTPERLEGAAAQLEAEKLPGATVSWIAGDVTREDDLIAAVERAGQAEGGLHLAVANAGKGGVGPLITTSLDEWNDILATNLTGAFLVVKHAGAAIARSGGGAIVAISSIAGVTTHRFMSPYAVSKAAIDMLVNSAADELGIANVRVNSVRPGIVDTELVEYPLADEAVLGSYLDGMPVRRVGTVDDVAAAVRFLLGPESSWITGDNVSVDGGHHLRVGPDYSGISRALFGDDAVEGRVPPAS